MREFFRCTEAPPHRWGLGAFLRGIRVAAFLGLALGGILAAAPVAAQAASGPLFGRDVTRRIGIGMVGSQTPLAVRYLVTPRTGFQVGMGLEHHEDAGGTDVFLAGGGLLAMAPGDRVNFYLCPGVRFASEHGPAGTTTTVGLSLGFSFEVFVTRDFSVTASQRLSLDFVSPPGDGENSRDRSVIFLSGGSWPRFGFFYYLPEF